VTNLLLAAYLVCPLFELKAPVAHEITWVDEWTLTNAQRTCKEDYGPRNPCVAVFHIVKPLKYRITCGPKEYQG
jgi:hypothetical protein